MLISSDWLALWVSLKVATGCLLVITAPGLAIAWVLARKTFPGKALLETAVHVPLVLPPVVTGYLLLLVLGRKGLVGQWLDAWLGVTFAFNTSGAVIAAAVMSFPLLVRAVRLAVELVDPKLEVAAASLGAGPIRVFLTVTLPLSGPGIVTGLMLAFARSLGEFGATIIFAGNLEGITQTLPLAVFTYMQIPDKESSVLWLAVISVLISTGALLLSEMSSRRLQRKMRGNR